MERIEALRAWGDGLRTMDYWYCAAADLIDSKYQRRREDAWSEYTAALAETPRPPVPAVSREEREALQRETLRRLLTQPLTTRRPVS